MMRALGRLARGIQIMGLVEKLETVQVHFTLDLAKPEGPTSILKILRGFPHGNE